jgi:hypothetical protein
MKGCAVHWVTNRLEGTWAMGWMTNELWSKFWHSKRFFWSPTSTLPLMSSHLHVVLRVKWPGQEATTLICLVPKWMCGPVLPPPSFYGFMAWCLIKHKDSCTAILYIKCCHVNELSAWWLSFGFSRCGMCFILSFQRSILPPSSGWLNFNEVTSFKQQFWLWCFVGLTGAWLGTTWPPDQDSPLAFKLFFDSLCI